MNNLAKNLTTLFGIGFFPYMPGTIASVVTVALYYLLINNISSTNLIFFFIFIFIVSIKLVNIYSNNIEKHDASEIVIDEFLGITFIMIFYNLIKFTNDFTMFLIILILFRFFDIIKIFPANLIDKKIINSFGILLDDIIAAIYCIITLYFINVYI